ncbi:MAG: hypothetical protein JNM39_10405 [Bdellovibrionaceae bacterium]|nr:hypothetical protein [Pseudobdellovibrionaceae bacterium]
MDHGTDSRYPSLTSFLIVIVSLTTSFAQATDFNSLDTFRSVHDGILIKQSYGALLCPRQKIQPLWQENRLAPPGCSSITPSGELVQTGIKAIIHAASASMGPFDDTTEPTEETISQSVKSGVLLAARFGIRRIAIPLIGGNIFVDRVRFNTEQDLNRFEKTQRLAEVIINAVTAVDPGLEYRFIGYDPEGATQFQNAETANWATKPWHVKLLSNLSHLLSNLSNSAVGKTSFKARSLVLKGNILDFSLHGADAIMNAANMELQFGGGLSGAIASKSERAQEIDDANLNLIKTFYANQ